MSAFGRKTDIKPLPLLARFNECPLSGVKHSIGALRNLGDAIRVPVPLRRNPPHAGRVFYLRCAREIAAAKDD